MPQLIQAGEVVAYRKQVKFRLISAVDGSPVVGATVTTRATINASASAAGGGTVTQKDATNEPGVYQYVPSSAEIAAGVEVLTLTFSATGALPVTVEVLIVADSPYVAGATAPVVATAVRSELTAELAKVAALSVTGGAVVASLTDAERDAAATAMFDLAGAIDGATLRQILRGLAAFYFGEATGLDTDTPEFSALDGSKVRVAGGVTGSTRTPTLDLS